MSRPAAVTVWLLSCCAMIAVMALLGAITRLTESGLSITHWDPVSGILPPLTAEDWRRAFGDYQAIPQYQLLHRGMTLAEFQQIFFWEWLHRLWGRLIGVVFVVPLILFWGRGQINRGTGFKLLAIFALGGVQGFIGWIMVQSGLEERTSVSPYRLALHLGFALAIYSALLWSALPGRQTPTPRLRHGWLALGFLALTMVWGAFTAGLQAGTIANTWPLMDGDMLPESATLLDPLWRNAFENPVLVQFIHRWLGPLTMILLLSWVGRCWRVIGARRSLTALGIMALLQVGLGLATLLSHVEIVIAVLHQAGAICLLTLLLYNLRHGGTPAHR